MRGRYKFAVILGLGPYVRYGSRYIKYSENQDKMKISLTHMYTSLAIF